MTMLNSLPFNLRADRNSPVPVFSKTFTSMFALCVAGVFWSPHVRAETPSAETIELALADEITVSATRNPLEAFSYPGSVSVIDRAEIDNLLPSSVSDLFDNIPGVLFSGGPRRTGEIPTIRGVEGEGVLVLFDGIRQSFLSGHDGRFFVEPDLLKSVEVVRGPGSSLYGSGAVGGVLAFRTMDAVDFLGEQKQFGYQLKTGFQGVNEEWASTGTVFARSEDGRFDGVASLTYRNSGDIDLGNGLALQSDDKILSGLVKGSVRITPDLKGSFTWLAFNDDAIEPNNGQGGNTGDLVDKTITSNTFRAGIDYTPKDNKWIDLGFLAYSNSAEVEEQELDSDRQITREVDTLGFSLDNRSRFTVGGATDIILTYGGEYYRDKQKGRDNATVDGTRGGVPDATADTYGLFAQAEITVNTGAGELLIIPGLRYDHFENEAAGEAVTTNDSAVSPKLGVSYKPVEWLLTFANYGEAFRAPSFNEIFADDIHFRIPLGPGLEAPNFFIPNPDLKPERSRTWEFGAGLDFKNILADQDAFTVKGSYFRSNVENLIDLEVNFVFSPSCFAPVPGPCTAGTSRNINTASARLKGYEIEAAYNNDDLYLNLGYSAIDGKDRNTGDYVGVLAADRLNLDGGVKLAAIDARLGARLEVAANFDKVNTVAEERDGYEIMDVYFVWAPASGALHGLRIDLGIDNITDANYERVFADVSEPGRNYKASVRWAQSF